MPVATSSRQRASRRQNSEEIEDARNTQVKKDDDVSDDDQPVRTKVKKEKKGKKKAVAEEDDDDVLAPDVEDDDDDDRINVANFPDQPLAKADLHKLKGISQDWEAMATQIGQQTSIYKDVAIAMAESGEMDTNSSKDLQMLDRDMREFLDVCTEMTLHAKAIDALHQRIASGEEVTDPQALYEEGLQQGMEAYAGKTTRQKYVKDKRYNDFQTSIWDVHHPNEPMPPLTNFIPQEDGDDDDDDDDLEMGGATQNYNCPLSLTVLVNPVTSRICGHSFSKDSIVEYFRHQNRPSKCPAAGCTKSFRLADCEPDPELAKKVKAHQRRLVLNRDDSDAEEIVD